jgi:hypothetical protein
MGYAPKKFGPYRQAEHVEVISASNCLACGHLVSDHHRAGGGWHNGKNDDPRKRRDHCIGQGDTCPCRVFVQPHTFTRKSIQLGRAS